jgi:uncharacterized integral membrane protein
MEGQRTSSPPAKRDTPWTLIIFGVVAVYAIVVAIANSERVKVDFVFFSASIRLLILIILCLGVGFAAGYLFNRMRAKRRASGG